MKQQVYGFRILAAIVAALTFGGPAIAGEGGAFKGKSSAVITVVGCNPAAPSVVCTHEVGDGEATHLKQFTVTGDARIDFAAGVVSESLTLTASNGDMLFLRMAALGVDATHGIGIVTIVGGTGQFQKATGYFVRFTTFSGPPGPPSVSISDVFDGTISFGRQ